jgi:UDP-3-O-[3-hydroxymyristoyl] glucosamine N-acyltransferase
VDNRKYLQQLTVTRAAACLVAPALAGRLPEATAPLLTPEPYRGFALALRLFYPDALYPKMAQATAIAAQTSVDPTAEVEEGVVIEPGAIVGPQARIGRGTRLAAGAVVGYRVTIGRDCYVGPLAAIAHALVGDRVILHAGARIGQDGFGFAMSPRGHLKVPQIGRVVIQDDVEIGANTTIDRGALKDTIIGEGTKIDNLVQIGHNVVVGRHCVIVAHTGIAGSTELGDFVVMGGQSGTVGHIKIGSGAQVAGAAHPTKDVAPGARVGGTPARPMTQWAREMGILAGMARRNRGGSGGSSEEGA